LIKTLNYPNHELPKPKLSKTQIFQIQNWPKTRISKPKSKRSSVGICLKLLQWRDFSYIRIYDISTSVNLFEDFIKNYSSRSRFNYKKLSFRELWIETDHEQRILKYILSNLDKSIVRSKIEWINKSSRKMKFYLLIVRNYIDFRWISPMIPKKVLINAQM
jgi:hypothetical protein